MIFKDLREERTTYTSPIDLIIIFSLDIHASSEDILYSATRLARKKFGIKNSTIQLERQTNAHNSNNILEPVINFV